MIGISMTHGFDKEKKEMRTTYPLITRNDPTPKKLKQQTLDPNNETFSENLIRYGFLSKDVQV